MTDRWEMVKLAGALTSAGKEGLDVFDLLRARLMRGEATAASVIQSGAAIVNVLKEKA